MPSDVLNIYETGIGKPIQLDPPPKTIERFKTLAEYKDFELWLDSVKERDLDEWMEVYRAYSKWDLYFLCRYVLMQGGLPHNPLGNVYLEHDLFIEWARQMERHMELYPSSVDASCRRTGKSFIRSLGIPIQLMLRYPDISMCLFSTELKLGTKHVALLQSELEKNSFLINLHPDIFWDNPREEAKRIGVAWSRADGLCIKGRRMNRSTQTFECHAMFGGGPVGAGYDVIFFDDCENSARVSSKEAIDDLDSAFSAAISLLTPIAIPRPLIFISNTRFSPDGLVQRKINQYKVREEDSVRMVPGEDIDGLTDFPEHYYTGIGPLGGRAIYPNTPESLAQKYSEVADKSEYVLQYCGSYQKASDRSLNKDKIVFYDENPKTMGAECYTYLNIDASRGAKDPMCLWVWGLPRDKRKIWLDARLLWIDPSNQRFHDEIFNLVTLWDNLSLRLIEIRVEDSANSTWTELIRSELVSRGCYKPVRKVQAATRYIERKFKSGKMDRIYDHWSPMINRGEVWFPKPASEGGRGIPYEDPKGNTACLVDYFFNIEFNPFPVSSHDDMLDAGGMLENARVNKEWPLQYPSPASWRESETYDRIGRSRSRRASGGTTWMSGG